jgi:uncharacterized membrane protein
MTTMLVVGILEFVLAVISFAIAFSTDDGVWLGIGCYTLLCGAVVVTVAFTTHNYDTAKARKQVDAVCYPYQVRNLHLDSHTFLFNCANNPRLRIVKAH